MISRYKFCLGSVLKDFTKDAQIEISLNCTMNDFLVDHRSIKKKGILNIYQHLMTRNNIKQCLFLLKKYLLDY